MLATILKSKTVIQATIKIMDTFVNMRKFINNDINTNNILLDHENRIINLEHVFNKINENNEVSKLFYEGQIYDAYSLLLSILMKAKEEIVIIDNYAGKELLDNIKSINKKIKIYSKNIDEILIKKYNSQYNNVFFLEMIHFMIDLF